MTERDTKILNIKERIRALSHQKDLDAGTINNMSNQEQIRSAADLNAKYLQNEFTVGYGDHVAERDNNYQLGQMAQNQQYNLQNMSVQQQNQLQQMATANGYDVSKMNQQQVNQLIQMAKAQGYNVDNMATQQGYTQDNMKMNHGFSMETLDKQFGQDLSKMAQSFRNQSALNTQDFNNKLKLMGDDLAKEQAAYELARSRESAKFTPGTSEYAINQAQIKQQSDQARGQIFDKYETEMQITNVLENKDFDINFNPNNVPTAGFNWGDIFKAGNPFSSGSTSMDYIKSGLGINPSPDDIKKYEAQKRAYDEYVKANGGS